MSELPAGVEPASPAEPRPSASTILVRPTGPGGLEVLLGLRSRRSRFMPGHLAFPGGGAEVQDGADDERAFRRCASRELIEETGMVVDPARWHAAGERTTPPLFPVRFCNRFFVERLDTETPAPEPATEEFERLEFLRPAEVIDRWRRGESKVPPPILPILRTLAEGGTDAAEPLARTVALANAREERAPRIEFAPGVWMLPMRSATMPPATHTNVWMPGGRSFVIIDPGSTEAAERERLLEVVERRRELGHRPVAVLLTHHHRDHTGGAVSTAQSLDLPLRAHPSVLALFESAAEQVEFDPIDDGSELDLDGVTLRAHYTPGHAAGHLVYELCERRQLVVGDLVSGISTILIDPDHGDMGQYLDSLRRAGELGARVLFPGHGPPLPAKALERLMQHRLEREARVVEQVTAAGTAVAEIARAAYAELPELPLELIRLQTLAHLVRLEQLGRVRREDPAGESWAPAGGAATDA